MSVTTAMMMNRAASEPCWSVRPKEKDTCRSKLFVVVDGWWFEMKSRRVDGLGTGKW
jgi:hypothetical protein